MKIRLLGAAVAAVFTLIGSAAHADDLADIRKGMAQITQEIAEFMARAADYEMVQFMLANVIGRFSFVSVLYALLCIVSEDVY